MINVTKPAMPSFDEYINEIKDIWDTSWLTNMGPKHQKFERELKLYLNCKNVSLYTNGHLALENAISVFNFPKGAEVITTPLTFASTTHAIVRNGLIPVFADVKPDDYTIDPENVRKLISDKTVAILPVHVYGNICDVKKLGEIAKENNLKIIYDAAHAFGIRINESSVANFGDISMFSFHATKVFNTIEGGALCYNSDALKNKLEDYKNFGIHDEEHIVYAGGNAKMNEFQAAMGICNLRHIDGEIEKRRHIVNRYIENLKGTNGIIICEPQNGVKSNYAYFPIVLDGYRKTRNEIILELKNHKIFARKYFYPLTNSFNCYDELVTANSNKTLIAEQISKNVLTLPLYSELDIIDVDRICEIIVK